MKMQQIPDIAFAVDGDTVHLEQSSGCGETVLIDLHRIHLQHIAEQMGTVIGPDKRDAAIATLCRRMRFLRGRIEDLRDLIEGIPCFPPVSGPSEDEIKVAELDDLAALFCDELPDAERSPKTNGGESDPGHPQEAIAGPRSSDHRDGTGEHPHAPDNAQEGT